MIQIITTQQKQNGISSAKKLHYFIFATLSLLIYSCKPTQKGIRKTIYRFLSITSVIPLLRGCLREVDGVFFRFAAANSRSQTGVFLIVN